MFKSNCSEGCTSCKDDNLKDKDGYTEPKLVGESNYNEDFDVIDNEDFDNGMLRHLNSSKIKIEETSGTEKEPDFLYSDGYDGEDHCLDANFMKKYEKIDGILKDAIDNSEIKDNIPYTKDDIWKDNIVMNDYYGKPEPLILDPSKVKLEMRSFSTGATRDLDNNKIDYEGFLDPLVLELFGKYMLKHQVQADGNLRTSDNWMKGIPKDVYMKSAWRHFHDWWMEHRNYKSREGLEDALMGLLFNIMGYTFEVLKEKNKSEDINNE